MIDNTFIETMYDFTYCSDVKDEWKSPELTLATCGDCEDFAILLRQRLLDQGISEDRIALVSGKLRTEYAQSRFYVNNYNRNGVEWKISDALTTGHMVLRVDDYYYDQSGFQWDFPALAEKKVVEMKPYLYGVVYYRESENTDLAKNKVEPEFTAH